MATLKHVAKYRFSKRVSFGEIKSVRDPDGVRRPHFKPEFTLWAAPYFLEQSLKYREDINTLKNFKQIAIRPNTDVTYSCHAMYDDEEYKIVNIQRHLTEKNTTYDLITLQSTVDG